MQGLGGGSMPRMRPGDFDAVWALIGLVGADKETRAYLTELHDAKTAHDQARKASEAATAAAKAREAAAKEAEDRAAQAEANLSVETTMASEDLARRELVVREMERAVEDRDTKLRKRSGNIEWRAQLLKKAGVVLAPDDG